MVHFDVTLSYETPEGWNRRRQVAVLELENGGLYVLSMSKLDAIVKERLAIEKSNTRKFYPKDELDEDFAIVEIRTQVLQEMQISEDIPGEKFSPCLKWIISK